MNQRIGRVLAGAGLVAAMAAGAFAALAPGQKAPLFTAKAAQDGKDFTFSLRRALAKGPVVVYFFPSAFTQGCDIEAHTFAQQKAQFTAAGATIIGVSADSISRLNAFSQSPEYCAGQFAVASDAALKIAGEYGVGAVTPHGTFKDVRGVEIHHAFMNRMTFVINRQGTVVATFSSSADHISPAQHVAKALAVVQSLQAK